MNNLLVGTGLSHEYVGDRAVALVSNGPATARQSNPTAKIGADAVNPPNGKAVLAQAADMRAAKPAGRDQQGAQSPERPKQLSEGLEEIIVSAQKKTENLQDVPIPMTVLGADSLMDQGEFRLQDYYTSVPGLNVTPGSDGSPSLTIRGISTGVYTNPTVGITVDDVPYGLFHGAGRGRLCAGHRPERFGPGGSAARTPRNAVWREQHRRPAEIRHARPLVPWRQRPPAGGFRRRLQRRPGWIQRERRRQCAAHRYAGHSCERIHPPRPRLHRQYPDRAARGQ